MKITLYPLLIILLLFNFSCSKEGDCDNPVDCLPPASQTGANTAGCLVNGEIFLPAGQSLNSGSVLHYQYLLHNGELIFSITMRNREGTHNRLVQVGATGVELMKNTTYPITLKSDNHVFAHYTIGGGLIDGFVTTEQVTGELNITNLDEAKGIISGTFWFDAINNEGEIVQIRQGRFDVRY